MNSNPSPWGALTPGPWGPILHWQSRSLPSSFLTAVHLVLQCTAKWARWPISLNKVYTNSTLFHSFHSIKLHVGRSSSRDLGRVQLSTDIQQTDVACLIDTTKEGVTHPVNQLMINREFLTSQSGPPISKGDSSDNAKSGAWSEP